MPTYVMLANWTDQGMRAIGDSPKRVDTAKKTLEEMGGQFRSVYMTMGMYDLIMIYDAPDDAVAARFTLMLGKLGNVRTTSLKAFPEEAYPPDRQHAAVARFIRRALSFSRRRESRRRQKGGATPGFPASRECRWMRSRSSVHGFSRYPWPSVTSSVRAPGIDSIFWRRR